MNGTNKILLSELTEKSHGKEKGAYRKALTKAFTPEGIAAVRPEHFAKTKKGKLK